MTMWNKLCIMLLLKHFSNDVKVARKHIMSLECKLMKGYTLVKQNKKEGLCSNFKLPY